MSESRREQFSVAQFFEDGSHEYVRRYVSGEEAMQAFKHYTRSVGAKHGFVKRVMIMDGGDLVVVEWQYGKGVTYDDGMMTT